VILVGLRLPRSYSYGTKFYLSFSRISTNAHYSLRQQQVKSAFPAKYSKHLSREGLYNTTSSLLIPSIYAAFGACDPRSTSGFGQHQNLTTSRGSPLAHALYQVWCHIHKHFRHTDTRTHRLRWSKHLLLLLLLHRSTYYILQIYINFNRFQSTAQKKCILSLL